MIISSSYVEATSAISVLFPSARRGAARRWYYRASARIVGKLYSQPRKRDRRANGQTDRQTDRQSHVQRTYQQADRIPPTTTTTKTTTTKTCTAITKTFYTRATTAGAARRGDDVYKLYTNTKNNLFGLAQAHTHTHTLKLRHTRTHADRHTQADSVVE